jgi:uncharacterized membrane protein (UPF0127 family)
MLHVEIADNPYKQAQGLMFRKSMPDQTGMIFLFRKAEKLRFWGVNTFIPLDIAFVDQHHKITKISHIKPLSDRSVESDTDCHIAIEANYGFFEKNKIAVGDRINFERQSDRVGIVAFDKGKKKTAQFAPQNNLSLTDDELNPDKVIPKLEHNKRILQNPQQGPQISKDRPKQDPSGLPVISLSDLGGILEDSYDEDEEVGLMDQGVEVPDDSQDQSLEMNQPEISPQQDELDEEPEPFDIPEEDYPEFSNPQEAIQWAQENKEVVRIWYTTKGGRDIEREIEPHGQFVAESTGNPIVVSFDETIGDIRAFILTHVLYHSFVGRQFNPKFVVEG